MKYQNSKKKIAILTYYHFPCSEQVLENVFAKELAREHDVILLFHGDSLSGRKQKWHNAIVLLAGETKGTKLISKLRNKVLKWSSFFNLLRLLFNDKIDIVLIRDLPLETLLIIPFRMLFRFKLYFQYTAPLGDINIGYYKVNKTIKRYGYLFLGCYFNFLIKIALKSADIVFPISDFHKKQLLLSVPKDKLIPITMGIDEDWIDKKNNKIEYLNELKKRKNLIVYFGTLSFARNPKFILKTFSEVKSKYPNCKLIMIGNTLEYWEKNELNLTCNNLGIKEDVIFTGFLDRNNLRDYIYYCDISISPIPPEAYYKISSPTKLYESLGLGLPVVANKGVYEQEKVIIESQGGLLVEYNTTAFCDAIISLLKNAKMREEMGKKGKEYVRKNYTYRQIAKKISPYFQ